MAMYISLIQFTEQGIRNVKDTVKRGDAAIGEAEKMGMKIIEEFWTMGAYDIVVLFEAPDDETMSAFLLKIGSMGNVKSQWATSRARPCAHSESRKWKAFWQSSNSPVGRRKFSALSLNERLGGESEFFDFPAQLLPCPACTLLQAAEQLIFLAFDESEIIIGQIGVFLFQFAFDFVPTPSK